MLVRTPRVGASVRLKHPIGESQLYRMYYRMPLQAIFAFKSFITQFAFKTTLILRREDQLGLKVIRIRFNFFWLKTNLVNYLHMASQGVR